MAVTVLAITDPTGRGRGLWQRPLDALVRAEAGRLTGPGSAEGPWPAEVVLAACEVALRTLERLEREGWLDGDGAAPVGRGPASA